MSMTKIKHESIFDAGGEITLSHAVFVSCKKTVGFFPPSIYFTRPWVFLSSAQLEFFTFR